MAEWFMPATLPQPDEVQTGYCLLCTYCGEPIEQGQQGVDILPGVAGVGTKSGRPMLVHAEGLEHHAATLHYECVTPYVLGEDEEACFCAGCDAKLNGDTE